MSRWNASDASPMSAMELVEITPASVTYAGHAHVIETGRPVIHAVFDEQMGAACGRAARRLLPTGWQWESPHPKHLTRCLACLERLPLPGGDAPA